MKEVKLVEKINKVLIESKYEINNDKKIFAMRLKTWQTYNDVQSLKRKIDFLIWELT